jgi:hypothetical protein
VKFADAPDLLLPALQACIGPAAGVELKAFIDHMDELPDIDAILAGACGDIPGPVDLQYGVAAALVRRAVDVRERPQAGVLLGNILRYAKGFPQREMGVMLVTDMHRSVGKPLFKIPEFADWAGSVTDLVLYDLDLGVRG